MDQEKTKGCPEWKTQVQQAPAKEIVDFAKAHPCDYMRKCLEQYPYWGNQDNGFNRKKFKEIFPDKVKLRVRFSLDNLKLDDDMLNIPLFMADQADRLIGLALEQKVAN